MRNMVDALKAYATLPVFNTSSGLWKKSHVGWHKPKAHPPMRNMVDALKAYATLQCSLQAQAPGILKHRRTCQRWIFFSAMRRSSGTDTGLCEAAST